MKNLFSSSRLVLFFFFKRFERLTCSVLPFLTCVTGLDWRVGRLNASLIRPEEWCPSLDITAGHLFSCCAHLWRCRGCRLGFSVATRRWKSRHSLFPNQCTSSFSVPSPFLRPTFCLFQTRFSIFYFDDFHRVCWETVLRGPSWRRCFDEEITSFFWLFLFCWNLISCPIISSDDWMNKKKPERFLMIGKVFNVAPLLKKKKGIPEKGSKF